MLILLLWNTYYVPVSVLNTVRHYFHFTDEKTEAQSGENFTQSHMASKRWIWDLTLGLPDFIEANDIVVITAANSDGTFPLRVAFC